MVIKKPCWISYEGEARKVGQEEHEYVMGSLELEMPAEFDRSRICVN